MMKIDIDKMVSNFLGWKLPKNFYPDGGIIFNRHDDYHLPSYPIGTNLFTATQAKEMIEFMLRDAITPQSVSTEDAEILNLMNFYQVDTERKLINAQAEHIEKLQARVSKAEMMNTPFGVKTYPPRIG